jgi:hypothetical protein
MEKQRREQKHGESSNNLDMCAFWKSVWTLPTSSSGKKFRVEGMSKPATYQGKPLQKAYCSRPSLSFMPSITRISVPHLVELSVLKGSMAGVLQKDSKTIYPGV